MRRQFHPILLDHMRRDNRIWVLTADLGFGFLDAIRDEFPNRFCNVGASESLLLGTAVGLSHDGLIPVAYSITSFLIYRPAEWIRNYLDHEGAAVKMVGGGRGSADHSQEDYAEDGVSHWAGDDRAFLSLFPCIKGYWPDGVDDLATATQEWLHHAGPSYLNLRR